MPGKCIARMSLVCLASLSGIVVVAQQPRPRPRPAPTPPSRPATPPAPLPATLLIEVDARARVQVDDTDVGIIEPDVLKRVPVTLGQHVVRATSVEFDSVRARAEVEAKTAAQLIVKLALRAQIDAFRSGGTRPAAASGAAVRTPPIVDAVLPGATWSRIPTGSFEFGCVPGDSACWNNERPRRRVEMPRPLDMLSTEVTVEQARRISPELATRQPSWSTDRHPVVNITFEQAARICEAVGGRLPTEVEWEYGARGGVAGGIYPWGNLPPVDRAGQPNGARSASKVGGAAVGLYSPNGFGLYDMAGNVGEWTSTRFDGLTVVRGGGWNAVAESLRVSNRDVRSGEFADAHVGFRCVREVRQ